WKSSYGDSVAPFTGADANGDGKVDMADFIAWRNSLGESIPAAAALAVVLPQNDPSPPVEALASLPAPLFPGRGEANRRGTFIDEGSSYRDGVAADDPLLLLGIRSPGEEEPREEGLPQAGVKESSSEQP